MPFPCVGRSFQLIVFNQAGRHQCRKLLQWSSLTSHVIHFIHDICKLGSWDPDHMKGFPLTVSESLWFICSLIQSLHVFSGSDFSPSFSILWEKMKEEPNYCRIKLLYMKDTLLWLWTLIPLENTETIILIYHAGSDDAMHWMKGCKTIIIYVYTYTYMSCQKVKEML